MIERGFNRSIADLFIQQVLRLLVTVTVISMMAGQALAIGAVDRQPDVDPLGRPTYFEGMMTIMLTEGVEPIPPQEGIVTLGISSLDVLVAEHGIQSVQKRFQHRPIAKDSGLPDLSRLYRLTFPGDRDVRDVVASFARDPNVAFAEPISIAYLEDVPDDLLYEQLQHLPQIWAPEAWDTHHGEDGSPIVIGIVDSGVDYNHPDLTDNVWQNLAEDADGDGHTLEYDPNQSSWELDAGDINGLDDDGNGFIDDLIGWNFRQSNNDPVDVGGHGTHCSGIAAGVTNNGLGIASISWNLRFMITKHWHYGFGALQFDGIIYAAENGADIISCSWGVYLYSQADRMAVDYALGLGSIVVSGAGNHNNDFKYRYPEAYPGVIAVASVSALDEKASYSNYGMHVDVCAPGGEWAVDGGILSTVPGGGYEGWNGCSMTSPMVAGLLGLIKSLHPDWNNEQIVTQMIGSTDDIYAANPSYENLLGSGRINAYRALSDTNVDVAQELRVDLLEQRVSDADGDGVLEPGEEVALGFTLRNYAHYVGSENATLTLVSDDPDVIILAGEYTGAIPADDYFDIDGVFRIQIAAQTTPHVATLTLTLDADVPVLFGGEMEIALLVAPAGVFVYESVADGIDRSGSYLRDLLQRLGLTVVYSNQITPGLASFDAVFLSLGNWGPRFRCGTYPTDAETAAIIDYLMQGGRMYAEAGYFLGTYDDLEHPDWFLIMDLFGLASHSWTQSLRITNLVGQAGSLAEGITFTETGQERCDWIENYVPATGAGTAFTEVLSRSVGIWNVGDFAQRTFLFSYSLSDLVDVDRESSRSNLVLRIIDFLELDLPEQYLLADFMPDVSAGPPPLTVQFTDLSHADPATPATSWVWDFDDDGTIDSYDQNPQWTFNEPGYHPVRLTVGNGTETDTFVFDDCVLVNDGVLVWDVAPGERDYSGSFIRDELIDLGYTPVTYASSFPTSLVGFDAAFLSFGNIGSKKGILNDVRSDVLLESLEQGGRIYLEGGDPLGRDQVGNTELHGAFGLDSVVDGEDSGCLELVGQPGSLASGVHFQGTNQFELDNIDHFVPGTNGVSAFEEPLYHTVGVQHEGAGGEKTFCFSYALAELVDLEPPSTRHDLLHSIIAFFGLPVSAVPEPVVPAVVRLVGNQPNPFNPLTTVTFELPQRQDVTVAVYDLRGRRVGVLFSGSQAAGRHQVKWNGQDESGCDVASGTYLVRLEAESVVAVRKMMLVR